MNKILTVYRTLGSAENFLQHRPYGFTSGQLNFRRIPPKFYSIDFKNMFDLDVFFDLIYTEFLVL